MAFRSVTGLYWVFKSCTTLSFHSNGRCKLNLPLRLSRFSAGTVDCGIQNLRLQLSLGSGFKGEDHQIYIFSPPGSLWRALTFLAPAIGNRRSLLSANWTWLQPNYCKALCWFPGSHCLLLLVWWHEFLPPPSEYSSNYVIDFRQYDSTEKTRNLVSRLQIGGPASVEQARTDMLRSATRRRVVPKNPFRIADTIAQNSSSFDQSSHSLSRGSSWLRAVLLANKEVVIGGMYFRSV